MFFNDTDNMIKISKTFNKESEYIKQKRTECFNKYSDKMLLNGYTPKNMRGPFVLDDWKKNPAGWSVK